MADIETSEALLSRREKWQLNFERVAQEGGFFRTLGDEHKALFVERGKTLVVAFENLDDARQDADNRMPWGVDFLTSRGWSALGMMAHGPTWYRDPHVWDFFDELRHEKFFDAFDRVVFYGGSMGGYGATAFSSVSPGADVVAFNPQATLNRDVTLGWENRFRKVWKRDFSGRYAYGPDEVKTARKVWIFYDPIIAQDAIHANLYSGDNVKKIRCRHMGHGMLTTWRHMGVLSKIVTGCIEDSITETEIHTLLTARTRAPFYQKRMLQYLLTLNRPYLVHTYCRAVVNASKPQLRPHFQHAMDQAAAKLKRSGTP